MDYNKKNILNKFFLFYFIASIAFISFILGIVLAFNNHPIYSWFYGSYIKLSKYVDGQSVIFEEDYKIVNEFEDLILLTQDKSDKIFLISKNGKEHVWNLDKIIESNDLLFDKKNNRPYATFLYPNGDIIISNDLKDDKSYLIKLDKNSEIIWKHPYSIHHWFSVNDKHIYFSDRTFFNFNEIQSIVSKYKSPFSSCTKNTINNESIIIEDIIIANVDDGSMLKRINILEKVLNHNYLKYLIIDCLDPLHINDVRVIKKDIKGSKINSGDIMISIRNMNTIIFLDKLNYQIKWFVCCNFFMQHSPRISELNNLVVFDNLGGHYYSRVIEINIRDKNIIGAYFGQINNFGKKEMFYSESRGYIDLSLNKYLVSSTDQNLIFEIECNDKIISQKCINKEIIKTKSGPTSADYYKKNKLKFLN